MLQGSPITVHPAGNTYSYNDKIFLTIIFNVQTEPLLSLPVLEPASLRMRGAGIAKKASDLLVHKV